MLHDCKATAGQISEDADDFQNQTIYLNGLTIYLMGAYSRVLWRTNPRDWSLRMSWLTIPTAAR